jgi:hypothetical protein
VIDVVKPLKYEPPIAAPKETETATETSATAQQGIEGSEADLPPVTIQACHRPEPLHTKHKAKHKSEHEDIKQGSYSFPRATVMPHRFRRQARVPSRPLVQ